MSRSSCRRETYEVFMTLFHAALLPDRIRIAERAMHGAVAATTPPAARAFPSTAAGACHKARTTSHGVDIAF
jgi:hypothetical protein